MKNLFLGIDLGGTNIKLGCFSEQLELLGKLSVPTGADRGPDFVIDAIKNGSKSLLNSIDKKLKDVAYAGIGSPGPVNLQKGLIVAAPNLPLFRNFPIRDALACALEIPVTMENDANAAAWAEHEVGVAAGIDEMVFLTLGTGIGGGVISNGQLLHGNFDAAGELGHIIIYPDSDRLCGCGQHGCAETFASATSTAKRANEALAQGRDSSLQQVFKEKGYVTCKDIYEHLDNGDQLAFEITEGTAKVLGILCVNILNFTSPQKIVFAGGMIAAGSKLLSRIKFNFEKYVWPGRQDSVEICFATLGEDAGIIGNAALAIREFKKGGH